MGSLQTYWRTSTSLTTPCSLQDAYYIYSDRIWNQKCSRKSSPAGIQISSDRFCNVCRGWKGLLYWGQFCTMLLSRLGDKSLDVLCTLRSYYIEYRGTAVVLVGSDMDMGPLFETQPTQPIIAIHYKVIDKTQPSKSNVQLQSHIINKTTAVAPAHNLDSLNFCWTQPWTNISYCVSNCWKISFWLSWTSRDAKDTPGNFRQKGKLLCMFFPASLKLLLSGHILYVTVLPNPTQPTIFLKCWTQSMGEPNPCPCLSRLYSWLTALWRCIDIGPLLLWISAS